MQYYRNNTPPEDDKPELDVNMSIEDKRKQLIDMIRKMDRKRRTAFVTEAIKDIKFSDIPGDKEFAEQLQVEFLGGLSDRDLLK